jgi:hypothetical protein
VWLRDRHKCFNDICPAADIAMCPGLCPIAIAIANYILCCFNIVEVYAMKHSKFCILSKCPESNISPIHSSGLILLLNVWTSSDWENIPSATQILEIANCWSKPWHMLPWQSCHQLSLMEDKWLPDQQQKLTLNVSYQISVSDNSVIIKLITKCFQFPNAMFLSCKKVLNCATITY